MIVDLDTFLDYVRNEIGGVDATTAQRALSAAELLVRQETQREFTAAASATRVYVPTDPYVLRIHDCHTITSVTDNGTAVTTTDMQYEPLNRLSWAGEYRPYEQIRRLSGSWYQDGMKATVSIVATFGWNEIPDPIEQAVLVLAKDIAAHRDVRFGIAAVTDYSGVRARQADIIEMLRKDYRRAEAWGIG